MGLIRRRAAPETGLRTLDAAATTDAIVPPSARTSDVSTVPPPGESLIPAAPPTRDEAMQVPAIARGRNVLCGTIGALPVRAYSTVAGVTGEVDGPGWLDNPDPRYTRVWTLAQTLDDLIFQGRAYWTVAGRLATGFPAAFNYVEHWRIGFQNVHYARYRYNVPPELDGDWRLTVDGKIVPDRDVVRFDAFTGTGMLVYGAHEIRAALALSDAARRFASVDLPLGVLQDLGPGMTDGEIDDVLSRWEMARRTHTTAYLGSSFKYDATTAMNPGELQLIEARQQSAIECARLMNLPSQYVSAPMGAGNITYQNVESMRRELIDVACGPWIAGLEQRLSMNDVTPRGTQLRFDIDAFTRSTSLDRWKSYETAFQIVDPVTGERALSVAEIRDRENFTPPGTQAPASAPPDARALTTPPPTRPTLAPRVGIPVDKPSPAPSDTTAPAPVPVGRP